MSLVDRDTGEVVSQEDYLEGLASRVRSEYRRSREAIGEAVDAYFAIGQCMLEARRELKSNEAFGAWLRSCEFGFSRQWAHILRTAAELEVPVRAALSSQLADGRTPNIEQAVKDAQVVLGKRQPAVSPPSPESRPLKSVEDLWVCNDCGESFPSEVWECPECGAHTRISEVECGNCHQTERGSDCIVIPVEADARPITKPDLGGGVSHPARFSHPILDVFAELVRPTDRVLDPFAGTGRIHELEDRGFVRQTIGVELEPEWAAMDDRTMVGSALDLRALELDDESFDVICTSPTYGNRLADHHNAADPELRRSYTHDLGRPLNEDNSGGLHWGPEYRAFHEDAWAEAVRVLKPGGRFLLNIKDHIRGGVRQPVAGWHVGCLQALDLTVVDLIAIGTPSLAAGANALARLATEFVIVMEKGE